MSESMPVISLLNMYDVQENSYTKKIKAIKKASKLNAIDHKVKRYILP